MNQKRKKETNISIYINFEYKFEDFLIDKEIDKGSFGLVCRMRHKTEKSNYIAMKKIQTTKQNESQIIKEIEILTNLENLKEKPNCYLRFYGYNRVQNPDESIFYSLYMEYKDCNLRDFVQKNQEIDFKTIISFTRQLLYGMAFLQTQKICHRDLKPDNILIENNQFIKIIDFGVSRDFQKYNSKDMTIVGTEEYLSPEFSYYFQLEDDYYFQNKHDDDEDKSIDRYRSDVFSFGLIIIFISIRAKISIDRKKNQKKKKILKEFASQTEELIEIFESTFNEEKYFNELLTILKKSLEVDADKRPDFIELYLEFKSLFDYKNNKFIAKNIILDYFSHYQIEENIMKESTKFKNIERKSQKKVIKEPEKIEFFEEKNKIIAKEEEEEKIEFLKKSKIIEKEEKIQKNVKVNNKEELNEAFDKNNEIYSLTIIQNKYVNENNQKKEDNYYVKFFQKILVSPQNLFKNLRILVLDFHHRAYFKEKNLGEYRDALSKLTCLEDLNIIIGNRHTTAAIKKHITDQLIKEINPFSFLLSLINLKKLSLTLSQNSLLEYASYRSLCEMIIKLDKIEDVFLDFSGGQFIILNDDFFSAKSILDLKKSLKHFQLPKEDQMKLIKIFNQKENLKLKIKFDEDF